MQVDRVVVGGARLGVFDGFAACLALFSSDGSEAAAEGRGAIQVRADGRVLLFHREGILAILSAEWLLTRVLRGLQQARLEHLKLLLLGFYVHCEVNEPVQSNIASIQSLNRPSYCFILVLILAAAERFLMGLVGNQPLNFELGDGLEILRRRRSDAPAGPVGELGNARLLAHTLVDLVVAGARPRVIRWHALTVLLIQQFHRAFALLARGQCGRASHHL